MKSSPALPNRTAPVFALFLLFCLVNLGHAQEKPIQQGGREMTRAMLNEIRQDLVKNYYDPKFQGFDVQARQMEKRGPVIGDTSSESVMSAPMYPHILEWIRLSLMPPK